MLGYKLHSIRSSRPSTQCIILHVFQWLCKFFACVSLYGYLNTAVKPRCGLSFLILIPPVQHLVAHTIGLVDEQARTRLVGDW